MAILTVDKLSMSFSGLKAVSNLDMELNEGELVGLIGPNGAGKTTVFNMLTGVYLPSEGSISFEGKKINGIPTYKLSYVGIARTFQNIRLFGDLTVIENVKIAYHQHVSYNMMTGMFRLPGYYRGEKDMEEKALEFLKIFGLDDKAEELAKNLPYGQQRRLEIARALATKPSLLLLDEPAAGMNPYETQNLMELIRWIRKEFNLTILLIEHDMSLVMGVCERIYVLDYGINIAHGTPDEIKSNPRVIEAYLGEEAI